MELPPSRYLIKSKTKIKRAGFKLATLLFHIKNPHFWILYFNCGLWDVHTISSEIILRYFDRYIAEIE